MNKFVAGGRRRSGGVAAEAFTVAESHADSQRAGRAAIQALEACMRTWASASSSDWVEWVARAERHAAPDTVERVYADLYEGHWCMLSEGPPAEAFVHFRRALERAGQLGDDAAFAAAAGQGLTYLQALPDLELIEGIARKLSDRSLSRAPTGHLAHGLLMAGRVLLSAGDREGAERAWQQLARLADDRHDPMATMWATAARGVHAILEGQFAEALQHMHAVENVYRVMQAGVGRVPRLTESAIGISLVSSDALRVRLYLGQVAEAIFDLSLLEGNVVEGHELLPQAHWILKAPEEVLTARRG